MRPKISFIMPVYNKAATLVQSFQSVLDQSMPDWELILIDDGSTDQSLNIASILQEKRIKKVFLSTTGGVVNAYREGIKRASAPYVIFHDSDDCSLPDRAEKCLNAIGDGDILYHGLYLVSRHPTYPVTGRKYMPAEKWEPGKIYTSQYLPGVICAKTEVLRKIKIPKEAEGAWDWMNHILLHQMGAKYVALNEGLYEYWRFPNNSLSHTNELGGRRQNSIKWIQEYLVKNKLVKSGHKFGKGFRGFVNQEKEDINLKFDR
jgi:glycosyltransferase involved in cell wall biosynthesis